MDAPLRLLLVADPADAARAVEPVRRQRPVAAALAPTRAVLAAALRDATWDAILVVPGGPVSDADVAQAVAGQPAPLFAVSSDGVPRGLTAVAAFAMPFEALDALPFVLASLATDVSGSPAAKAPVAAPPDAPSFVSAANATLAETSRATAAFAGDFSDLLPGRPDSPAEVFVSAANATLAESARATAALPDALAAASHLPPEPLALDMPAPGAPVATPDAATSDAAAPPAASSPAAAPVGAATLQTPAPALTPASAASSVMTREAETLAQSLPIGVYRSTPDGRILYANPALADVLGVDGLDALRRLDVRADLGYPRDAFSEIMRRDGAVRNHTVAWTNPRGAAVYTRESARAVVDPEGRLVCYEGTMEDVTAEMTAREGERLRARHHAAVVHFAEAADTAASAEALAQAAVAALLAAMQSDWVLMLLYDADGGMTLAAWAGHFSADSAAALTADPAFGRLPIAAAPMLVRDTEGELPEWLPPSIGDVMRAHRMRSLGVFPMHRAGAPLGALVAGYDAPHSFSAIEQQAAEVLAWHLAGHLARHRAEQDLRDADASLRFIATRSAQTLYRLRYTPEGVRFDYLSPAVEALTGYDPAALEAAGGFDALIKARDVYAGDGLAHHAVPDATHYHATYRIRTRAGETRWIENHAYPWHDAEGAPLGLVGAFQDVTARKRLDDDRADGAQQALARQSALVELARLDSAADHSSRTAELACETAGVDGAAVWLLDGDRLTRRAATGSVATTSDEPLPAALVDAAADLPDGTRVLVIDDVTTDARVASAHAFFDARGTHAVLAAPVRRGPDTVGMVVLHRTSAGEPWTEAEAEYAAGLADAVSLAVERAERAAAEKALRHSETRYRALSDLTSDYAFAIRQHPDGRHEVVWATDTFERITGLPVDALLDADGLNRILHPDSLADVRTAFDHLAESGEVSVEARILVLNDQERWIRHRARVGAGTADGTVMVYHTGEDVTERKQFEADLVTARESAERSRAEAETMVRLKTAFLANMSHEIRTPLTGILGYAELLAEEVADEQQPFVASITSSGQRLLDTLNSVLDLAQLEADGVCPDLHPVDVAREARHVVDALHVLATRRGLALDVVAEGPAVAALDSACLGRILTNLVGNALKFTDAGQVRVVVDTAAGVLPGSDGLAVRIRVRDTGIGIPEAFVPHLFDEFRQETDGQGRSHEGSGLGLSITRRLTHLLGGHLSVESRRPGGSTFTVVFPALAPDALPAASAPVAREPTPVEDDPVPVADDPAPAIALPPSISVDPPFAPVLRPPSPAAPGRAAAPGTPSQTSMFDFRFTSPRASAAPPDPSSEEATVEWTTAPPPAAPPVPAPAEPAPAEPATAADAQAIPTRAMPAPVADAPAVPAPSGPRPAWPVDPSAGRMPVMIVRPAQPEPPLADPPSEQPPAEAPPEASTDAGDERLPILVVEDNLDTRVLLDRILRGTYAVTAVGDARSALTAMASTRFRALVLDINLGGKETGTDILRVARSLDGYSDVFAVALTAYALPGDRERLLESGFDGYISKPFTRQSLMDVLSEGIRQ